MEHFYVDDDNVLFDKPLLEVGYNFGLEVEELPFDEDPGNIVAWVVHLLEKALEDVNFKG